MATRGPEPSDGLEFQDAQSDDEDAEWFDQDDVDLMQVRVVLPRDIPGSQVILSEVQAVRSAFQPNGATPLPMTDAIGKCRDMMAKVAPPFFAFSRMLGEEQRRAMWTVFGVCEEFSNCETMSQLDDTRRRLRRVFNADLGCEGLDHVWGALRASLGRYALVRRAFEDYADGVATRPGQGLAFETTDALLAHAYRSAGVVGLIALPVLAEEVAVHPQVVEAAIALGMALKLTELLNCVGHHFRLIGVCWVPRDKLRRHGIEYSDLEANLLQKSTTLVGDARWQAAMRELLALVPPFLCNAAAGGEKLAGGGRLAVRAAVRMCRRMLSRIEARGYNSLGPHEEMFSWRIIGDMAGAVVQPAAADDERGNGVVWGDTGL